MSGLSGTVGLLNNGGDDLSVSSNGGFTFPTSLVRRGLVRRDGRDAAGRPDLRGRPAERGRSRART